MWTFKAEIMSIISGSFLSEEIPVNYLTYDPMNDDCIEWIQHYLNDQLSELNPVDILETIIDRAETILEVIHNTDIRNLMPKINHDNPSILKAFGIKVDEADYHSSLNYRMNQIAECPIFPSRIIEKCIEGFRAPEAIVSIFMILMNMQHREMELGDPEEETKK